MATSVGTDFLNIVKEEFPADHPYHHILNEHTVKFSYSVMPNLKKKINNHNVKIAKKAEDTKKNNIENDPKEDDYDPEEQIDHELEEVVPDDDPVVEEGEEGDGDDSSGASCRKVHGVASHGGSLGDEDEKTEAASRGTLGCWVEAGAGAWAPAASRWGEAAGHGAGALARSFRPQEVPRQTNLQ